MAKLTAAPLFVKAFEATLDLDDYGAFATTIMFQPQQSQQSTTAVDGTTYSETVDGGWTVQITHLQDWESAKSLSRYFYKNAGTTKALKFKPKAGTGLPSFTSDVSIGHSPIGGSAGQFGSVSVTFGCSKPVLDSDDDPMTPEA